VRGIFADAAENGPDTISWRRHFFDDFLEFFYRLPGFDENLFVPRNFHAQIEQLAPHGVAGRECGDQKIDAIEQIECPFTFVPFVAHFFSPD
jgi:hypothetical protein